MGKIIYVYLNDRDLSSILQIFDRFEISCRGHNVGAVKAISNKLTKFVFSNNDQSFIRFIPCFYTGNQLQCASFYLDNDDMVMNSAFFNIKKHIKKTFRLSQDKSYYIGIGIYEDWCNGKYCFPTLFKYQNFYAEEKHIDELFAKILDKGFIIRNNNSRLRNLNNLDLSSKEFVIFSKKSQMIKTILNKNTIRYEFGSECIFVFEREKNIWEFVLDERIQGVATMEIIDLFWRIHQSWDAD